MIRQGDVMLVPTSVESGEWEDQEQVVLAEGEATGHAHVLAKAAVVAAMGKRFVRLAESSVVTHQEHAEITVPAGTYEIVIQREYRPEGIRNVTD